MKVSFRQVSSSEVNDAYAVYLGLFEWLNAKGVRQWLRALPRDVLVERQAGGELFACFIDGRIAAVVTLASENNPYWTDLLGEERLWWIKSLAVARAHGGGGVGAQVMRECESRICGAGATQAFIDCVDAGFLPRYYVRLGYEPLARKDITYPSGNTFAMVLMRKTVGPTPEGSR